jgi:hypothetical protein
MQVLDYDKKDPNWNGNFATGQAPCYCEGCTVTQVPAPPPPTGIGVLQNYTAPPPPSDPDPQPPTSIVPTNVFERVLYSAYFRVSEYETFLQKCSTMVNQMQRPAQPEPEDANRTITAIYSKLKPMVSAKWTGEIFDIFEKGPYASRNLVTFADDHISNASGDHYFRGIDGIFGADIFNVLNLPNPILPKANVSIFGITSTASISKSKLPLGVLTLNKEVTMGTTLGSQLEFVETQAVDKAKGLLTSYPVYTCGNMHLADASLHPYIRVYCKCPTTSTNLQLGSPHDYPIIATYRLPGRGATSAYPLNLNK